MHSALVTFLMIALVADIALIIFATTRQDRKRSIYFATLTAAIFIYSLGYMLEIMNTTPEAAMVALKVENVGIPLLAPFFLLTVMSLFGARYIKRWMLPVGIIYGMGMFFIVLFNDYHHLYYSSIEMIYDGVFYFAKLGKGPLYATQQIISIALMVIAYSFVFSRFFAGSKKLRVQMSYLLFGSLISMVANMLNFSGVLPSGFDPMPFALTISLVLISINIFHHKIMDIVTLSSNMAIETMDDSMIVVDNSWSFIFCNESAKRLFPSLIFFEGSEAIEHVEHWPEELMPGRRKGGQFTFGLEKEAGLRKSYRANISPIFSSSSRRTQVGWSIVIRDMTDVTLLMDQLEDLAMTDPLTGILNRRHFSTLVRRELAEASRQDRSTELIIYDLDFFKKINDTYGHDAGDYVLCSVVETVKIQLRSYDIFARYGGEEFVIFTAMGCQEDLSALALRLREAIMDTKVVYEGTSIPITASFGIVLIPPGTDYESAMRAADEALYRAKSGGRNIVVQGELIV